MKKHNIVDSLSRPLRDLRISVIDQCNFRCSYCMPADIFGTDYPFLHENELLTFHEIVKIAKIFTKLGVTKIRLTGGEPLLRKDLPQLIKRLTDIDGVEDIALTTNGIFLPKYAKQLKEAGLQRVNVSLDAIDDEIFGQINGRMVKTAPVLKGIETAQDAGLIVKVNMVVKKGVNDQQILPMARYFKEKGIVLRFIEFMDVGNTNGWDLSQVVSKAEILELIHKEMPLEAAAANYFGEVASRFKYQDGSSEIGVISSVTDSFCSSCTRARLSADGKIYTCLFADEGYDLKHLIRTEAGDEKILQTIAAIWEKRADRYSDERLKNTQYRKKQKIEMSYIGG